MKYRVIKTHDPETKTPFYVQVKEQKKWSDLVESQTMLGHRISLTIWFKTLDEAKKAIEFHRLKNKKEIVFEVEY